MPFFFRRNGHVPLFMILVREGGHAGVAGFPGDPLVLILAGAGGVEDNALLGRQGRALSDPASPVRQRPKRAQPDSPPAPEASRRERGSVQGSFFHGIHLI